MVKESLSGGTGVLLQEEGANQSKGWVGKTGKKANGGTPLMVATRLPCPGEHRPEGLGLSRAPLAKSDRLC